MFFFFFTFHLISYSLREPGKKFKAGPWIKQLEAEAMEEHFILTLLPWLTQFAFLDNSGSPT